MYMYNLNQHLHFVGIGGVGMAAIAEVLLNLGYSISGSDIQRGQLVRHLEELGVKISIGHNPANLPDDTTTLIYSSAVMDSNPEVQEAIKRNLQIIQRAEMLAEIMRMKYGIAIAGSHGKTTTTSLTGHLLSEAGLDPTVIVGARLLGRASGAFVGSGQYVVAEADESDGSFCLLKPAIAVVTNIDSEHLSHYGSFSELLQAFSNFVSAVPFYGLVVACADDPFVAKILQGLKRRVITYGLNPERDIYAKDLRTDGLSTIYQLVVFGEEVGEIKLPLPGEHLVKNSLASVAIALELGVYPEEIPEILETFGGVARRSQVICEENGICIMDDYAHHPTEITATLKSIREAKLKNGGRLIAIFQPHRYSRTQELFEDFAASFSDVDLLYLSDIYPAGEEEIAGVNSDTLASSIVGPKVIRIREVSDELAEQLSSELKENDLVITLGAGSIGNFAHALASKNIKPQRFANS